MEYRPVVIRDIIRDINRDYYLPAIQREFVWEPYRIEKLFDSIMGDFPIGSFLFWKVKEEKKDDWAVYEFIRNFDKEVPHNPPADLHGVNKDIYLVLDGQQRLTSLYIGLRGTYRYFYYKYKKTKLYLNLLKQPTSNEEDPEELTYEFKFREHSTNGDGKLWYEVGKILDHEDAEDAKADVKPMLTGLTDDDKDNANKLIGRLHARIHTVLVINYYEEKSQDYDKVLNIFVRANSSGKILEYSDLLLSTATAKWQELDARTEINDLTDRMNRIGPGYSFGKDFILKGSLYLTEDLPIQYRVKNFNKSNLIKIEDNWDTIKTFFETTIRLVSKFGFSQKNIVAPIAILPVAFFIMKAGDDKFDKSTEEARVKMQISLRKWLILAFLKNAFGSATDTRLKNVRDVILGMPTLESFPIEEINTSLGIETKLNDSEIETFLKSTYQGKYTFLILSLLYPDRDWKDMVFHEDHIFPKTEFQLRNLKKLGYDDAKIASYLSVYDSILNLQLLTDTENLSKSATPFDSWLSTRDANFKNRHHIPDLKSYGMDSFEDFIQARKNKIYDVLKSM
jgi:hypothetical protein